MNKKFTETLDRLLKSERRPAVQIAQETGIGAPYLSQLRKGGKVKPAMEVIVRLAQTLGVPVTTFTDSEHISERQIYDTAPDPYSEPIEDLVMRDEPSAEAPPPPAHARTPAQTEAYYILEHKLRTSPVEEAYGTVDNLIRYLRDGGPLTVFVADNLQIAVSHIYDVAKQVQPPTQ